MSRLVEIPMISEHTVRLCMPLLNHRSPSQSLANSADHSTNYLSIQKVIVVNSQIVFIITEYTIPFERYYSPKLVPLASLLDLAVSAVAHLAKSFLFLYLKFDQQVRIYI